MKDLLGVDVPDIEPAKPAPPPKPPKPPERFYTCDQCQRKAPGEPRVVLRGIAGRLGLSLPGELHERVFCTPNCFWVWKGNNAPRRPDLTTIEFEP